MLEINYDFNAGYTKPVDMSPISLYQGYKWDKISPGATGIYSFEVANVGNVNDTYALTITGFPMNWSLFECPWHSQNIRSGQQY